MKITEQKHAEARLEPNTYQPNKFEFEEELRVRSNFDETTKSLVSAVEYKRDSW